MIGDWRPARPGLPLLAAFLLLTLSAAALAGSPATEGVAGWRLDSPLVSAAGTALWLVDGAGSWRVEIGQATEHHPDVEDLLTRQGTGWTLACAGPAAVLMQAWGEPWQEVDGAMAATVARLLARWGGQITAMPAAPPAARRPWRAASGRAPAAQTLTIDQLPAAWSVPGEPLAHQDCRSALRRALTLRGRGRGGPGLRLDVTTAPSGGLELTSPRWPATVHLEPAVLNHRSDVPPEAFLPIWSLADLGMFPVEP